MSSYWNEELTSKAETLPGINLENLVSSCVKHTGEWQSEIDFDLCARLLMDKFKGDPHWMKTHVASHRRGRAK